jgi:serine/threonine-protein kinase RsbW
LAGTSVRARLHEPGNGRDLAIFVGVGAAYAIGYVLAWKWFSAPGQGASFFPPAGVTLAALVLLARREWPFVLAAAATAEVSLDLGRGLDAAGTVGIALANVVEPLVGALLLLQLAAAVDLRLKRHLAAFLAAAVVVAPAVGAAIAATTFVSVIGGSGWTRFAFEWWAGDGLAVLVVGGAILSFRPIPRLAGRRLVEGLLLCGAAVLTTFVVFDRGWFAFVYLPVVVLVVLAFRVGTSGVAVTGALVSFVAAGATAEAEDFWASVDVSPADRVLYLQLALAVIVATAMALAAEIAERERIVARLARSEMEHSAAMERAELRDRVETAHLQSESLRRSAEQLSRSASVDDVAAVAVAMVREWGADHSAFFALEDGRLRLRAILGLEGPSGPLYGETPLSVETPVTEAVKRDEPLVASDPVEFEERFPSFSRVLAERGWQTYGVFPVEAGGAVCGAFTVAATPPGWITDERRELLTTLSAQIGVALGRALLVDAEREFNRRSEIVHRLTATLERRMGFQDRAEAGAAQLVRNGLELVRIHRPDEDGEQRLVAAAGVRRADARMRRLDRLARTVAASGHTALLREPPDGAGTTGRGAVAPLFARGRLLGTVTVRLPRDSELTMTPAFAEEIAARLALSLDNALVYEHERDVSHALQIGLLGRSPSPVEGADVASVYRPGTAALEVGGDWYDTFHLGDGELALVVGDVVGHGLEAAVAMGQLRGAVRALAPTGSPSRVLDALDLFVEQVPQAAMSTLAYAVLDLEDGTLVYACAGHPPPLLVGEDGARLLWDGRSLPLGATFEDVQRTQAIDRLAPGETVVLYTDGLVEDRRRGISSGLDALLAVGGRVGGEDPGDIVDEILDGVLEQSEADDDVCILAVRRSPWASRFVHAFAAAPHEVRTMRRAFAGWLETVGVDADQRHDVVLAASEAAANAVEHGYGYDATGTIRLEAWASDHSLHVTIEDGGTWREPRTTPDRGRGREIIEALMRDVSFENDSGGTIVRMRLPLVRPVSG